MKTTAYVTEEPRTDCVNSFYVSNRPPLLPGPLVKLPLGAVRAEGWIGRQLELMAGGMTGRLGELSRFVQPDNEWLAETTPPAAEAAKRGSVPRGAERGWEELPYWLRGFHDLGVLLDDRRIVTEAHQWIEAAIAGAEDDGWFGPRSCKQLAEEGRTVADLWPHMVMTDALISHHEHSGDERVIPLMRRFFRWCAALDDEQFLPAIRRPEFTRSGWQAVRAADMLTQIHWLFNHTGEESLLGLARRVHEKVSPPQSEWLDHHVVNFTQRFREPGAWYVQSCDPADLAETERWYARHMGTWGRQPGGLFGADERIRPGKTDPKQACETCAMVEFNKSFYLLGRACGGSLYADRVEDIVFNSLPAAQTPDLKALHYLTAANQPMLGAGTNHDYYNETRPGRNGVVQLPYSPHLYRCCQHNVAMGWPYYVEHLWLASPDNGLVGWLYGPSRVTAKVGRGVEVTIQERTAYPFDEAVRLVIRTPEPVEFPLYLRVPRWCGDLRVAVNGQPVEVGARPRPADGGSGYVVLRRAWSDGDRVELTMPMEVTLTEWPKAGHSVTVNRGPLSFSLRIDERWRRCGGTDDWPEWEVLPASPWNYGLVLDRDDPAAGLEVVERPAAAAESSGQAPRGDPAAVPGQPWTLPNAPVEIRARGKRIPDWTLVNGTVTALQPSPVRSEQPVEEITLVPMGCARLRISCLPTLGDGPDARPWRRVTSHG